MTVFSEYSLQETVFPEFNINLNYAAKHISKPDTIKYVMWDYVGATDSDIMLSHLWFNSGFAYYLAESTADWPITGTAHRTNTNLAIDSVGRAPTECDDTTCCIIQYDLLMISTTVFETCRGI